jgi:hypothetical protein
LLQDSPMHVLMFLFRWRSAWFVAAAMSLYLFFIIFINFINLHFYFIQ